MTSSDDNEMELQKPHSSEPPVDNNSETSIHRGEFLQSELCLKEPLWNLWSFLLLSVATFCVLWSLTGDMMLPYKDAGYLFTIFLIYLAAVILSKLAILLKMPGLVGMLIAGKLPMKMLIAARSRAVTIVGLQSKIVMLQALLLLR